MTLSTGICVGDPNRSGTLFSPGLTAQFDCEGKRLVFWVSPTGRPALLDYVLVPAACAPALITLPTPSMCDFHAGIDHFPVLASCTFLLATEGRAPPVRLLRGSLATAQARQVVKDAFCSLPPVPGWTDPTTHMRP